ncbi:MAG: electron transfer flavoprotein-ubiquinone oxidoreductase [Candidatus Eisenbacteria bacterium]
MSERETLEVDVLFVGAGPANLSAALHLGNLIARHNEGVAAGTHPGPALAEIQLAVIEKSAEIGDHGFSGAVLDPIALDELMPDWRDRGFPVESEVTGEDVYFLTERGKLRFPIAPPPLANHGNYVVSLGNVARFLGAQVEAQGAYVLTATPAVDVVMDGGRVAGVITGDKGIDKHGQRKPNYEPGSELRARVTVFGEGPRGTIQKRLGATLGLDRRDHPQVYGTGVKELWELPAGRFPKGHVVHTMGAPLDSRTYGGSWLYGMDANLLSLGFMVGLDYERPTLDLHAVLQRFKAHPWLEELLAGGKVVGYGAKAVPLAGYHAMPEPVIDGALFIGDSGGHVNAARLKGIHLAMKSGMLAAETIFDGLLRGDLGKAQLLTWKDRFRASWAHRELWGGRNFHQGFERGLWAGMAFTGIQTVTGGWAPYEGKPTRPGHARMRTLAALGPEATAAARVGEPTVAKKFPLPDQLEKLADLHHSGTIHEEDQPPHLVIKSEDVTTICNDRCKREYGNPCQHFCPANVYEMVLDSAAGGTRLRLNASNCVHCKTCDIMDPYQVITWVPPEGGGGPRYRKL